MKTNGWARSARSFAFQATFHYVTAVAQARAMCITEASPAAAGESVTSSFACSFSSLIS